MEENKIDEVNDIMTLFLDNLTEIAKIHTEYNEKLGEYDSFCKFQNLM